MVPTFHAAPWQESDVAHSTPLYKRALYWLGRPLLSAEARRHLSRETLQTLRPSLVLKSRGFPLETRRRWAAAPLRGHPLATVLVQGTGTGWDVLSWARLRPKRIVATDLFEFADSWKEIAAYCSARWGVSVEFRRASLEDHGFLPDASIDLCGSDAVFEHCRDLAAVLAESHRVIRPGGVLYASYGPLWFTAGGDHFSGRGGLQHAFNHVALNPDSYRAYFRRELLPNEDFQSGGRYVELDLFSKLTSREYLRAYAEAGFALDGLILELSEDALAFARRFPGAFAELARKYQGRCTRDDFLIKAHLVRLRRM